MSSNSTPVLQDRVAVVTGASGGLGARFAAILAQGGAQVVAGARRTDRLHELAKSQTGIHPMSLDVTSEPDRRNFVDSTMERFGRIDVCVNNAGIASGGPKRQADLAVFRSVLDVNVVGLFAMTMLVGEKMVAQGSGSIINVSSTLSFRASPPFPDAAYVTSKSAVNGMTRDLAVQWARSGVRVNAIAPGWFRSEMNEDLMRHEPSLKHLESQCPMGRIGRIDEFDGALLFLASDSSSYCTGQVITIDGGWSIR